MKAAIALFARAPIPGRVKTRLIGSLSAEEVADLYRAFVLDVWEMLSVLAREAKLFLYADREHQEWHALAGGSTRLQKGADLGERMLRCFEEMQAAGHRPLLILGSDSPALAPETIAPWVELLGRHPSLLGPAEDGGYYAIGCRAPHPRMFERVEWSGPHTLAQTAAALEHCGLPPGYLPLHYDVDAPLDLERLRREVSLGQHTSRWLGEHR